MTHVAVVIGGGALDPGAVASLPTDVVVVAADSGLDHAVAAGLRPIALVGDMDSISASGRMWAYAHEVHTVTSPTDKDLTDTELALNMALDVPEVSGITVLGGVGDRLDHLLGTLLAIGHPVLAPLGVIRAHLGATRFEAVHTDEPTRVYVGAGRTFSLLALHGNVTGLRVSGAKWELDGAFLTPAEARGVSNEAKEDWVEVTTHGGVLTVVVPG